MAGRGDNNKHGSAGRGARNQSNQRFVPDGRTEPASDHDKHANGGQTSIDQEPTRDPDANRGSGPGAAPVRMLHNEKRSFDILIDDVPYLVKAEPFTYNDEMRYYISINGGPNHVFTWDSELKQLRAVDDNAATLPGALESEISERLQSASGR